MSYSEEEEECIFCREMNDGTITNPVDCDPLPKMINNKWKCPVCCDESEEDEDDEDEDDEDDEDGEEDDWCECCFCNVELTNKPSAMAGDYCVCINCYNGWKEEEDKKNYRQIVKKSIIDWFGETILKPYARICKNDGTLQQFKEKMKKIIDEI